MSLKTKIYYQVAIVFLNFKIDYSVLYKIDYSAKFIFQKQNLVPNLFISKMTFLALKTTYESDQKNDKTFKTLSEFFN